MVAGILQHVEEAGIHSGDSAAMLPPHKVSRADQDGLDVRPLQAINS
ncbi:MAG TPA: hypothetical protein VGS22_05150 [Thermoanaerobaculia bacterium]|nr:hypothetical protein [Thermoanaerobaculia bacterium]